MTDALKWGALTREERVRICLHDLAKYYADESVDILDQYIDAFDVLWSNEYCGGDAMFLPGQFSRFYEAAKKPEGNIHFAGEHLSKHHTWIAGALESAHNSVQQMTGAEMPTLGKEHCLRQPRQRLERQKPVEVMEKASKFEGQASTVSSMLSRFIIPLHHNVQYVEVF